MQDKSDEGRSVLRNRGHLLKKISGYKLVVLIHSKRGGEKTKNKIKKEAYVFWQIQLGKCTECHEIRGSRMALSSQASEFWFHPLILNWESSTFSFLSIKSLLPLLKARWANCSLLGVTSMILYPSNLLVSNLRSNLQKAVHHLSEMCVHSRLLIKWNKSRQLAILSFSVFFLKSKLNAIKLKTS